MLFGVTAAPDGSPVEVYARLPEPGEGKVVRSVVPAGGSVLAGLRLERRLDPRWFLARVQPAE